MLLGRLPAWGPTRHTGPPHPGLGPWAGPELKVLGAPVRSRVGPGYLGVQASVVLTP